MNASPCTPTPYNSGSKRAADDTVQEQVVVGGGEMQDQDQDGVRVQEQDQVGVGVQEQVVGGGEVQEQVLEQEQIDGKVPFDVLGSPVTKSFFRSRNSHRLQRRVASESEEEESEGLEDGIIAASVVKFLNNSSLDDSYDDSVVDLSELTTPVKGPEAIVIDVVPSPARKGTTPVCLGSVGSPPPRAQVLLAKRPVIQKKKKTVVGKKQTKRQYH
jgi:hypothetical protein